MNVSIEWLARFRALKLRGTTHLDGTATGNLDVCKVYVGLHLPQDILSCITSQYSQQKKFT